VPLKKKPKLPVVSPKEKEDPHPGLTAFKETSKVMKEISDAIKAKSLSKEENTALLKKLFSEPGALSGPPLPEPQYLPHVSFGTKEHLKKLAQVGHQGPKKTNFGLMYGQQPLGFINSVGMEAKLNEAQSKGNLLLSPHHLSEIYCPLGTDPEYTHVIYDQESLVMVTSKYPWYEICQYYGIPQDAPEKLYFHIKDVLEASHPDTTPKFPWLDKMIVDPKYVDYKGLKIQGHSVIESQQNMLKEMSLKSLSEGYNKVLGEMYQGDTKTMKDLADSMFSSVVESIPEEPKTETLPQIKALSVTESLVQEYLVLYKKAEELELNKITARMNDIRKQLQSIAQEDYPPQEAVGFSSPEGYMIFGPQPNGIEITDHQGLIKKIMDTFGFEALKSVINFKITELRKILGEGELNHFVVTDGDK
jgi:hypothetical protein